MSCRAGSCVPPPARPDFGREGGAHEAPYRRSCLLGLRCREGLVMPHWKGPWLPHEKAADYCGMSLRTFTSFVAASELLQAARVNRKLGTIRRHSFYPVTALDAAMREGGKA